ncbi:class I SAM-dependent methyltransferase [Microbacterium sp. UCD-TDU]|uniref:class I SAM-dependent methyltransferase n=1 Tax=Microbacterium sp. UCD-TDU TaxID=1247714 RepID=UPI0003823A6A|nr:class I SAM-dependent methyltransferase [Microbacterium sp. UCD-TDU]EYT59345.1 SAM-dependent methlyltransferase [Microbacterium sp. UCD-TDU]
MPEQALARSFESIGDDYDRYRPGFPAEAATVIVPAAVDAALDLGAGTGKFTRLLAARARHTCAVEPSERMLDVLRSTLPGVEALVGTAERIPLGDASVQVVTVAQAFHWFDRGPACAEISRVLVPGGTLGLLWNRADPECAWDRACHGIAHPAAAGASADSADEELPGFELVLRTQLRWTESIAREHYLHRWTTVSSVLIADQPTRTRMLGDIETVIDASEQTCGRDLFDLPHVTEIYVYRRA